MTAILPLGSNTKSSSTAINSLGVTTTAAASAGDTVLVAVVLKFTTEPTGFTVTDTAGNTYTVTILSDSRLVAFARSVLTSPLAVGDSISVAWTGSTDVLAAAITVDTAAASLTLRGTIATPTQVASSAVHTLSVSETAGTLVWAADAVPSSEATCVTSSPFTQSSLALGGNRSIATAYHAPTATGSANFTDSWDTGHSGSMLAISFDVAAPAAPVANAGTDQSVTAGTTVTLDGSASTGDGITYSWAHTSGPSALAALSDPAAAKPFYTPTTSGVDVWTLTVTARSGQTSTDSVSITAANRSPLANAGPDQTTSVGTTVTLDASRSSDPDTGDTLTYAWVHDSGPNGSDLSSSTAIKPTYTARNAGTDVWTLTVTDNHGASTTDDITVSVGVAPAKIRVNGGWVPAGVKMRVSGAWVDV